MEQEENTVLGAEAHKTEDLVYWAIVAISLIGIAAVIVFIAIGQSNPENFTALFFEDYDNSVSDRFAKFSFTIQNSEAKEMAYTADIFFGSVLVESLEISVPKDSNYTETILKPFDLDPRKQHKITVSLRDRSESIHFWTNAKKEFEKLIPEADFAFSEGKAQATEQWGISFSSGSTAKTYFVVKEEAAGEFLKTVYSIDASPENDFVFIWQELNLGDSEFNYLKISAVCNNAADSFWIKLIEKDGSIYRHKITIGSELQGQQIPLADFLLAGWSEDNNFILDTQELGRIELGFEDPELGQKQDFTVYFTGLEFVK